MPNRKLARPAVQRRLLKSNHNRRTMFFETLEERRVMANQFLNFDEALAPESFSQQTELTNQYAAQGVSFGGISGPGWEVLNDSGNFGITGYSAPNFLAWNTDVTSAEQRIEFHLPVSSVSLQVGSTEAGQFTASAFDDLGQLIGSTSVALSAQMSTIELPFDEISSVQLTTSAWFGVLDNLQFDTPEPSLPVSVALDANGNLTIQDSLTDPNNNRLTLSTDGTNLILRDPKVGFDSAPTPGSLLSPGGRVLMIPLDEFSGSITVLAGGGDDTLTVDYAGGNPIPGGFTFDGGTQNTSVGDLLVLNNGTFDTVVHKLVGTRNTGSGSIDLNNDGIDDIHYAGLEPVVDNFDVANRIFTIDPDVTDAVLDNNATAGSSQLRFTSNSFEDIIFTNPSTSLTINTQGNSLVQLGTMDAAYNPGTITFNGLASDTFRLTAPEVIPNAAQLNLNGAATLDLNTRNETVARLTGSGTITDNGAGTGTSTFTVAALTTTISNLITDGPTRQVALNIANNNVGLASLALTSANTFSGGLTLLNTGGGTRLIVNGAVSNVGTAGSIVSSPFGRGPITIGQAATDRAGIYIAAGGVTILNDIVFNTTLGTDRPGIRLDVTGATLAGTITANLSDANFSTNGTGGVTLTGQVTGPRGLVLDNTFGTTITVTLSNAAANNNYLGDTFIAGTRGVLTLGLNNQLPDGATAGIVNNLGTVNLNGRTDTINGLFGTGTVTNTSGTAATLIVGANNTSSAYLGRIRDGSDTGANVVNLTKIGSGEFTLLNNNSYTGTTTISQGILRAGAAGMSPVAAGLAYRLDATQTATMLQTVGGTAVTTTGQTVAQWNLAPASGTNYEQGNGALAPTYQASAINGKPAVRFDGVDDRLVLGSAISPQALFIVNRPNATQKGLAGIFGNTDPGDKGLRLGSATSYRVGGDANDFAHNQNLYFINGVATNNYAANTPHVVAALRGTLHTTAYNNNVMGGYFGGREWGGDIGEVLVYTTALTANQRMLNEAYLFGKWMVPDANYISDSSAVVVANGATFDVTGVTETVGSLATDAPTSTTAAVLLGNGSLAAGGNNASTTFAGTISGAGGSIAKYGTGQWTLTNGSNSYTGTTTINAGSIRVTASGALGTIAGGTSVLPGGSLVLDNVNYSLLEPLTLAGTGVGGNGALLAQNGTSSFAGPVTVNSATISNVALGKTAAQNSDYAAANGAFVAVDGVGATGTGFPNVTHTNGGSVGGFDWWQVDLGSSLPLSSMNIANRSDCCGNRLADYWVFVSDTPFLATDTPAILAARPDTYANHQQRQPANVSSVALNGATGRYLRIQVGVSTVFSLAEVQVFSAIAAATSSTTIGTAAGTDSLTLSNTIANPTAGSTLQFAGAGTHVASNVLSGAGAIAKLDTGSLTLGGPNTYDGATTISAGSVVVNTSTALGSTTGATTVADGATLRITGSGLSIAETLTLAGTGVANAGALVNTANNNSVTGAINVVIASTNNVRVNSEAGTLSLTNTVDLRSAQLYVGGAGNVTISGAITETTTTIGQFVQITNNGTGSRSLQLSEIEAFLVGVAAAGGLDPANNVALNTIAGTGYVSSGPGTIAHGATASLNNGVLAGGATSFNLNPAVGNNIVMTLGQLRDIGRVRVWQRNDSCCQDRLSDFTISILANNGGAPGGVVSRATYPGQVPTNSFADILPTAVKGGVVKDGAGILTLSGATPNTFTGDFGFSAGTVVLNKTAGVNAIGGNLVNLGTAGGFIEWGADEQLPDTTEVDFGTVGHMHLSLLGRNETVARITATAGLGVIQNRQAQAGINTSGTFTVNGAAASNFNGYIRDNAGGSGTGLLNFIKDGSGIVTLSGANITHTGLTTVNGGTLAFASANVGRGALTINNGGTFNSAAGNAIDSMVGPFTVNAGGLMTNSSGPDNVNGQLFLNGGTLAATVAGNGTYGNWVLNYNSGPAVIVGGTSTSTISADVRVGNNQDRIFQVASTGDPSGIDLAVPGKIGHLNGITWGFMTKTGPGTMELSSTVNEIGRITVSAGKLIFKNSMSGMGNGGLINNAIVDADIAVNATFAQPFAGSGTFNKKGAGTLQFNGLNQRITTTGQINIEQGILQNNNNSVNWSGNTANMNISAGAVLDLFADPVYVNNLTGLGTVRNTFGNGGDRSSAAFFTERLFVGVAGGSSQFDGLITDTGIAGPGTNAGLLELIKQGAGTFTITNSANSYGGETIIAAGELVVTTSGALGTTVGGTTVLPSASLILDSTNYTAAEPLSLSGTGSTGAGALLARNGASSYAGPITIESQATTQTNVSLGKAATQVSTLSNPANPVAGKAVDGNTSGNFNSGSTTHTAGGPVRWWEVDLGATFDLTTLNIWNRTDCCGDRLADYWVFLSDTPFQSTDTPAILAARANTYNNRQLTQPNPSATLNIYASGRYLRVQRNDAGQDLSLAEVQAFSFAPATTSANSVGTATAADSLTLSGAITNAVAGSELQFVGAGNILQTVASAIGGAGSVAKLDAGMLTFSGSNTYLGTTTVNAGTLQLQNGAAIDDNAGAVTVDLGATLQLLTSETISAYVGLGDNVGSNDSLLALGANTLTTTGSAAIANVSSSGGAIIAGDAIIDNDDDTNITGTNIYLRAVNGIGTAGDPIETAVAAIQVYNTTSGVVNVANSNAGALLTVSDLGGLGSAGFGARNLGGALTITNSSPLTIAAPVIAAGTVTLTASDSATNDVDHLIVNATVESTTADVFLNAGDNATINAAITAATDVTINVDYLSADTLGSTATINAAITTPLGNYTFLNGNIEADTFELAPQSTTEFRIFGDDPTDAPGDVLSMDVTGLGATLSAPGSVFTGAGSGDWTFAGGLLPVRFGSIENLDITGNYHLGYNNDATKAGNLVLMLDASGDNFELRNGSTIGALLLSGSLATVLSLTVNGNTDNVAEQLTIDDVNGLPMFSSSPVGGPDNLNIAGTASVLFNGNAGTNTLSFNLIQAGTSQLVGLGDGLAGADNSAEVLTTNNLPESLSVYGTSLANISRTGGGMAAGALTILAEAGDDTINIAANNPNTDITTSGYATFSFSGNNYSALNIFGGLGADALTLSGYGSGQTDILPTTLDGDTASDTGVATNGDSSDDTLRVISTSGNTGPVTLRGGAGNDQFFLGDSTITSTLNGIVGPVIVAGEAGIDTLNVDDQGSTGDKVIIVTETTIDGITGATGTEVSYSSIEVLNLLGGTGNDTITADMDGAATDLVTASLNGGGGDDTLLLSGVANLANLYLLGGAGNDSLGTAADPIIPTATTQVILSGEAGTTAASNTTTPLNPTSPADGASDEIFIDISSFTTAEVVDTGSGQVISIGTMPGHAPLYFNGMEEISLYDGNVLTNVGLGDLYLRSTDDGTADNILFYRGYTSASDVLIRMNNRMVSNTPFRPTTRVVAYGRGGGDSIQLNYTAGTIAAEFHGEDGNDKLLGSFQNDLLVGGAHNDHLIGMDGNDILWGDQQALAWAGRSGDNSVGSTDGDDILEGTAGDDFIFGGGGNDLLNGMSGNDYLHGGFGNDNLVGGDGNDFLRAGDGNDTLVGDAGDDIAIAGAGDDFIYGSAGRDFHLAGADSDRIYDLNDNGEDISVTETLTYDEDLINASYDPNDPLTFFGPNDAALLALMTTWTGAGAFATRAAAASSLLLPLATNDGAIDYMYGNTLAQDYSLVVTGAHYSSSTGDEIDEL